MGLLRRSVAGGLAALAVFGLAGPSAWAQDSLRLDVRPIALDPDDPARKRIGPLEWRGGLAITSGDARFGGLSGLVVDATDGELVAVSDAGHWLTARLRLDRDGRLTGLDDARVLPIRDRKGRPLTTKRNADAEDLARLADGSFLVAFERNHRVARYAAPGSKSQLPPKPGGLAQAPTNKGIEALAVLPDARVFALSEGFFAGPDLKGWVQTAGKWQPLLYRPHGPFRPSGAAASPDGRWVYVVERAVTLLAGFMTRIVRLNTEAIRSGAVLEGEEIARLPGGNRFDNIEGISVSRGRDGRMLFYLISDDNFRSNLLRTVLLQFALVE
jgi:hypothetical protein